MSLISDTDRIPPKSTSLMSISYRHILCTHSQFLMPPQATQRTFHIAYTNSPFFESLRATLMTLAVARICAMDLGAPKLKTYAG